ADLAVRAPLAAGLVERAHAHDLAAERAAVAAPDGPIFAGRRGYGQNVARHGPSVDPPAGAEPANAADGKREGTRHGVARFERLRRVALHHIRVVARPAEAVRTKHHDQLVLGDDTEVDRVVRQNGDAAVADAHHHLPTLGERPSRPSLQ